MVEGAISTKLYPIPNDVANKYKAHVLLTENREISKEEAVNELLLFAGQNVLPRDVVKSLGIDKPIKKS